MLNASDPNNQNHARDARYSRQTTLREFGLRGQEALVHARVLIVGAGGLGSPAAMYLAAAGVGTVGLMDNDVVDASNLHRQLLYGTHDIGNSKLVAARARLADINPLVKVVLHNAKLSDTNAREVISQYDVVLDGTDNFPARYAVNDACVAIGIPFVYGSVARFEGQLSVFAAPDGPCYRCLFPNPPAPGSVPSCAEDGVLGVLPGIVGLHQATEVIKLLTGIGRPLIGRLLMLDLLDHSTGEVQLVRNANCVTCGTPARVHNSAVDSDASDKPLAAYSHNTPAQPMASAPEVDVTTVANRLKAGDQLVLLDVREQWEYDIAHLPYASLVPLSSLPNELPALDRTKEYIVYCHHGSRSSMAANWLMTQGFERVSNMTGGIDAWSMSVDPTVAQY